MAWTVTKENGAVSFSSWLAREAAAVEAEQNALRQAFRANPPFSLKPLPHDEPDPFLTELPCQAGTDHTSRLGDQSQAAHDAGALHRRMAAMAHEFNNLFTVVIGNLELVEAAVHGDAGAEDSAAEAVAAAQRGAQLTRRLMALAHGETVASVVDIVDASVVEDAAAAAPGKPRDKATVLVVEDDAAVRATAAGYLSGFGYRVIEASDAAAALQVLQDDDTIDVLFTDVVLPGPMNGFDLSQAASLIRPNLKIIHASGYPKGSTVYQDEPRLSENLIAKPYRRDHLRRVFAATLAGKRPAAKAG